MLIALIQIIGGFILLVWSADRLVVGASATGSNLGIPPLIVGLTVVGFGTSAPEMVVSAIASLNGNPGLAVGNAIGSNITNIGLILGITAIVYPLTVDSGVLRKEFPVLIFIMLLTSALMLDGVLSQLDGYILLVGMVALVLTMVMLGLKRGESDPMLKEYEAEIPRNMPMPIALAWLAVGLVLLPVSSGFLVEGAITIAHTYGISDTVIGLTIIAFGTSLPELAACVSSAIKNEDDIAIGNIIGSNMFNLLGVLGIGAAIGSIELEAMVMQRDVIAMYVFTLVLLGMTWRLRGPGYISRTTGAILLLMFVAFSGLVGWQTLA